MSQIHSQVFYAEKAGQTIRVGFLLGESRSTVPAPYS